MSKYIKRCTYNKIKYNKMEIKLNGKQGGTALVSQNDFDFLNKYQWCLDGKGYVQGIVDGNTVKMHRYIMNPDLNLLVDHINGIRHDNRRENLRVVTINQNNQNKHVSKNKKSSTYKGVYFNGQKKKFVVYVIINSKNHYLGEFEEEIEAAKRYDHFIIYKNLDHMKLNFPENLKNYKEEKYIENKKEKVTEYNGVHKYQKRYKARYYTKGKEIIILISGDSLECAEAYDKYIVENNVPGKKLNFPEKYLEYKPNQLVVKTEYENYDNETVKLILTNKNYNVLIDKEDYEKVKYYICYIDNGYVYINNIDEKKIGLHRYLMKVYDSKIFIDHIDSNPMNNKKNNLRISNAKKNSQNKSKAKNSTSKYYGVSLCKDREKKWRCQIKKDNKILYQYSNEIEEISARARDIYILNNLKDDNYKLNFKWNDNELQKWKSIIEKN